MKMITISLPVPLSLSLPLFFAFPVRYAKEKSHLKFTPISQKSLTIFPKVTLHDCTQKKTPTDKPIKTYAQQQQQQQQQKTCLQKVVYFDKAIIEHGFDMDSKLMNEGGDVKWEVDFKKMR